LYRNRTLRLCGAVLAPVVLMGGLGLAAHFFLLVPAEPRADTPPDEVVAYIAHPDGLPRLSGARREALIQAQITRLVRDETYRRLFLAALRTSTTEEQRAFRSNLFDVFKPIIMADVERYQQTPEAERLPYLDERIIAYNRMARMVGQVHIGKQELGPAAASPEELFQLLMAKTTEEERARALGFFAALQERVEAILADPQLRADMEARIAAG
jgi:hypothetical protein